MTSIADMNRIAALEKRLADLERVVAELLAERKPNWRPTARRAVIAALARPPGTRMTPAELAAATGKTRGAVKMACWRACKAGEVVADGRGRYGRRW